MVNEGDVDERDFIFMVLILSRRFEVVYVFTEFIT